MLTLTKPSMKNLDSPDETRLFDNGKFELVYLQDNTIARFALQPGWRWSKDVKPLVNTESCQMAHLLYILQGRLHVKMDDGTEFEAAAGDAVAIPAGHDAWVVGNEPVIAVDFGQMKDYAREIVTERIEIQDRDVMEF